ncbi:TRAP transporter substrate-binding protein [Pontivivens insulae]|uniref:Monocarboxylate 2-oxoacid-binding periplasmic protein n=1 Tax=Pontivivens insulae TaxID=1639689 RepID=A0A2R8AF37_9RHOB|nr:TRAP transporter substrate-binding protein [Pontivivens insulae]RED11929.1 TRAP-type mannitol/chloroaromatic compound transport system substrate-binding protein [Pontivivens insulae]SPF30685.1 Monocarboxylate 2-oxoacid-binding periplasmic protein [Pontivivens insulae]
MPHTSISRRAALGAAAAAPAALAAPLYAQGVRQMRMVTSWPADLAILSGSAQRTADTIGELSDGRLQVEVFPAGTLMGAFDVHDAVGAGDVEFYHSADYYFQGKHRGFNFFTSVPLGLMMTEIHGWLRFGGGQELWEELSGRYNVRTIACGGTGVQMGGWFNNAIESIDDIADLKMRIPGLGAAVLRELGAETVVTPGGQIVEALFNGDINALEWVGPNDDLAFGFPKLLSTYIFPGFQEPGTVSGLGMNLDMWNGLDARDQAIIQTAADIENSQSCSDYYAGNGKALSQMLMEYGTEPTRIPDDVFDQLADIAYRVRGSVAEEDELGARINESFLNYQRGLMEWNSESFAAYFARRDAAEAVFGSGQDDF